VLVPIWSMPRPGLCPRDPPLDPTVGKRLVSRTVGRRAGGCADLTCPQANGRTRSANFTRSRPHGIPSTRAGSYSTAIAAWLNLNQPAGELAG